MIPALRNLSYEMHHKYLNGFNEVTIKGLFDRDNNLRTRNSGHKLVRKTYTTSQTLKFLPVKITRTWNQLPENIVTAGTENTFKNCLDKFLERNSQFCKALIPYHS
ncbi:hypothetical protein FHG87_023113 [Trinorchestia longiramus]|nr:hypothetical protein FHG87_023113 [Trinorchestia longiramus]